jgi:transposase
MIAVIGITEIKTALYGDWHVDGDIFTNFIKKCLVPALQLSQIVIMDNLSTYKVASIKALIEAAGAQLIYLTPVFSRFNTNRIIWVKDKIFYQETGGKDSEDIRESN